MERLNSAMADIGAVVEDTSNPDVKHSLQEALDKIEAYLQDELNFRGLKIQLGEGGQVFCKPVGQFNFSEMTLMAALLQHMITKKFMNDEAQAIVEHERKKRIVTPTAGRSGPEA